MEVGDRPGTGSLKPTAHRVHESRKVFPAGEDFASGMNQVPEGPERTSEPLPSGRMTGAQPAAAAFGTDREIPGCMFESGAWRDADL